MRAVLASANPGKLRELRRALPDWEIEPLGADDYPPETGETYYENARAKALFGREREPGRWVLGEDSGLEVAGLDGAPGIKSARFAGGLHVERVLAELEGVQGAARRARYVCELVALSPEGEEHRGTGILEGRIAEAAVRLGGLRLRPGLHPGRRGADRSRARRRLEGGELPSRASRAGAGGGAALGEPRDRVLFLPGLAPPPVDLGAEHDRVGHQVEPDQEDHRCAQRAQRQGFVPL